MRTKKSPYAISRDNRIFVSVNACGIGFARLLHDGVCLSRFGKRKETFIALDDCIAWYDKELPFVHSKHKKMHEDMLVALKESRENIERGIGNEAHHENAL